MEGKETVLLESFATKVAEQKSLGIITNTGKDHAEILSKYGGLLGTQNLTKIPRISSSDFLKHYYIHYPGRWRRRCWLVVIENYYSQIYSDLFSDLLRNLLVKIFGLRSIKNKKGFFNCIFLFCLQSILNGQNCKRV